MPVDLGAPSTEKLWEPLE